MELNIDATFGGQVTCSLKNKVRNLRNLHHSTFESIKIWTLMRSFYPKQKMHELRIYRGGLRQDNEESYQILRGIDLPVQSCHEEFDRF